MSVADRATVVATTTPRRAFDYLAASSAGQVRGGQDLQIMFGIGGEHDLTERELPHLAGWRDSRPVWVGNGAWNQRQIDVYGELLGSAHRLVEQLNPDHPGATAWREFLAASSRPRRRGVRISDGQMAALPLARHEWHGDWNYTPRPTRTFPSPPPIRSTSPAPTWPGCATPR